jgi:hypothetical protein
MLLHAARFPDHSRDSATHIDFMPEKILIAEASF